MRNDILNKFLSYGRDNESIISIFYNKSDNDDEFINVYTVVNDVIIGKLEEELRILFDNIVLINRKKDSIEVDKKSHNYTSIRAYLEDSTRISETIISKDLYEEFVKTLKNDIEYIYASKDAKSPQVNDEFKYDLPKEYEFNSCVNNFFANALETSLYIKQKDNLAAAIKMGDVRDELLKMLNFHIKDKFYGQKDMGIDGRALKHTLTKDLRDELSLCFNTDDLLDIYNCLFRSCVLFRKVGLHEAKNLNFTYDKEADVRTMRVLRDNYKKLESFLR